MSCLSISSRAICSGFWFKWWIGLFHKVRKAEQNCRKMNACLRCRYGRQGLRSINTSTSSVLRTNSTGDVEYRQERTRTALGGTKLNRILKPRTKKLSDYPLMTTLYLPLRSLLSLRIPIAIGTVSAVFLPQRKTKQAQRAQRFIRNSHKVYTSR